jgi:hypothetical protein
MPRMILGLLFYFVVVPLPCFADNRGCLPAPSSRGAPPRTQSFKADVLRARDKCKGLIVQLKDGRIIKGRVIGFTDTWFMVKDEKPFKSDRIDSINYADVKSMGPRSGAALLLNDVSTKALRAMKRGGCYAAIPVVLPMLVPIVIASGILGHPIISF